MTTRSFDEATPSRRKRPVVSPERPDTPTIPSFHLSLRVPAGQGHEMFNADGKNILGDMHMEWDRIQRISDSLRRGQLPGVTGSMIRDVVVVGRGVPIMALRFVYLALCKDHAANLGRRAGMTGQRRIKFLTSVDPIRAAAVVSDLDPASTLVISISIQENDEVAMANKTMTTWLLQSLGHGRRQETVLSKHMMFVTGNEKIAASSKPESVFLIPSHSRSEPFSSFTAATLLPLSITFGWSIVEQFIAGAHSMDSHFVETNPRHNLPILLALTDVWNDSFLGSNGRIISPYTEAFAAYPTFCACIEVQTCGASRGSSSLVIDGGLHCSYDRILYAGDSPLPSELIMTMNSQLNSNAPNFHGMEDVQRAQDALICSMFAHADELAFGADHHHHHHYFKGAGSLSSVSAEVPMGNPSDGNRPSTLLMCGICDAFACGELVALAEHRAIVKARILDVDPFPKEIGSTIRTDRTQKLKDRLQELLVSGEDTDDDEDIPGMNLSTNTILRHYAGQVKEERMHVSKT